MKKVIRENYLYLRSNYVNSLSSNSKKDQYEFYKKYSDPIKKIIFSECFTRDKLIIGGFYPIKKEINSLRIMKNLDRYIPMITTLPSVVDKEKKTMEFREYDEDLELEKDVFNIPCPSKNSKIYVPEVMLMPLLAFDRKLNRIGYGAGCYDRYLATVDKKVLKIGIAFEFQHSVDDLPVDESDIKMDYVVTESFTWTAF